MAGGDKEIMTQALRRCLRDLAEGRGGVGGGGGGGGACGLWGEVGGSCIALALPGGCAGGGSPLPLLLLALTPG
jgi:hypothetical protein